MPTFIGVRAPRETAYSPMVRGDFYTEMEIAVPDIENLLFRTSVYAYLCFHYVTRLQDRSPTLFGVPRENSAYGGC
ncbi:hypothetical protein HS088_TW16G00520 [Tripterygium wilfordii]|uniref:Uncharacterized protein n=1 Tax=Tripterygium wilfordii TaxID=458696 RepID=A0A7J7CJ41_TRIWF|nr:hypothetical protein HS088_TW16G00520 [Tripterygium wilfordii]